MVGITIRWGIVTYIKHRHAVVWCLLALPAITKSRQFKEIGRGVGALLVAGLVVDLTLLLSVFGVQQCPWTCIPRSTQFAAKLIVISLCILAG
ncbi:TPA: hypothetical protein L6A15_15415 [Pseudomonas aeruginosa]|nr:hypothetical protein [Pseudomonas aeruginosa]HBP6355322.1 hypothetical protein [Pseudomonas aeruginosa]